MILDYYFNKKKKQFAISYVKDNGGKGLLKYNVARFKTFTHHPNGKFRDVFGQACSESYTENPKWCDYLTFIEELPETDRKLLQGKATPKLYTFDIEVAYDADEFPEPSEAKFPVQTISVVNDKFDAIVLGTKSMTREEELKTTQRYHAWLGGSDFFKMLGLPMPRFQYLHFETESVMLEYFLKNIVAKAPAMAGWNSLGFDWYYITTRIQRYYPNIILNSCSMDWTMDSRRIVDFKNQKVYLKIPTHTLLIDMMDVVGSFDYSVLPIKENLSLDYISTNSVGMSKIKYEGDLQKLYYEDYPTYVFYNMIDSVLVQFIDKKFQTLQSLYIQSQICKNKALTSLSKIAIAESMFFKYFTKNNIKIVPRTATPEDLGEYEGAYVCQPTPGKHMFNSCNDFASLYPRTIITCNLSVENYLGGPSDFTEEQRAAFRNDPNYFVTVTDCVFANDKDYAFKAIQDELGKDRNVQKYLYKKMDATVAVDLDHIKEGHTDIKDSKYADDVISKLKEIGFDIEKPSDIKNYDLNDFDAKLNFEITYLSNYEQGIKYVMNGMYGGCGNRYFEWYNQNLASSITGEARNIIHKMESHIPEHFENHWYEMTDLHKKLGIEVDKKRTDIVKVVYGDTDSLYMTYANLLETIKDVDKMSVHDKINVIVKINTEYLNEHNREYMAKYYTTRHSRDMVHEFELETVSLSGIWLDVKKRYAQMIVWQDGKWFDEGHYKVKVKGLEVVKGSYPQPARNILKGLLNTLLSEDSDNLIHILNREMQVGKCQWMQAPLNTIVPSISCHKYNEYVISDNEPDGPVCKKGAPFHMKGLAYYNWLRQIHNLPGDPVYQGKLKYYIVFNPNRRKTTTDQIFVYHPDNYPEWAEQYAPIDRAAMFNKYVMDPFNRILKAIGMPELQMNGSLCTGSLFDF